MPWEEPPELHSGQVEQVRNREQALGALAGIAGSGGITGGFVVEPERVEAAIAQLDLIVGDLTRELRDWRRTEVPPPTLDGVGMNLVTNASRMAANATAWLEAWANQIADARDALLAQLEGYRQIEQQNTAVLP